MSSLLRIMRPLRPVAFRPTAFRPIRTFSTIHQPKTRISATFFSSSHPASPPLSSVGLRHVSLSRLTPGRLFKKRPFSSGYNPHTPSTNMGILYIMIGINVGVFAYYHYVAELARQGNRRPLAVWWRTFTLNLNEVVNDGQWWQTVTCVFTHTGIVHIVCNMASAFYLGRYVAWTPGVSPAKFLILTLGSGIAGSVGFLYERVRKMKAAGGGYDHNRALGFSGAVMGIGAAAAAMYPRAQMLLYGIVPIPLWALMGGYLFYDGYYLQSQKMSDTCHSGHLGGLAFGLVYYFVGMRAGVTKLF